jgi:hypothetical protein
MTGKSAIIAPELLVIVRLIAPLVLDILIVGRVVVARGYTVTGFEYVAGTSSGSVATIVQHELVE